MKEKEKKKAGRPRKANMRTSCSIPIELVDYAKSIGHQSVSLGLTLMWEEIVKPVLTAKKDGKKVKIS